MKLLNIVGHCTACEISLRNEILQFKDEYDIMELVVTQELVDQYGLEKTPALVLLGDQDEFLGKLYGFQPSFILQQWLQMKGKGK